MKKIFAYNREIYFADKKFLMELISKLLIDDELDMISYHSKINLVDYQYLKYFKGLKNFVNDNKEDYEFIIMMRKIYRENPEDYQNKKYLKKLNKLKD